MRTFAVADVVSLEHALDDLDGLATLLLDASRAQDPQQAGITAAARLLENIHQRLVQAVGFKDAAQ